jgi:predicted DNA-binding protein
MTRKRDPNAAGKARAKRASVSLSPDMYKTLQAIANQKKVSTAWVLRDAAERYVAEQWPLFATSPQDRRVG